MPVVMSYEKAIFKISNVASINFHELNCTQYVWGEVWTNRVRQDEVVRDADGALWPSGRVKSYLGSHQTDTFASCNSLYQ